jgi:hypothetical protein
LKEEKRSSGGAVWSAASDLQKVGCGVVVCDLCDRVHEPVRYGTCDVWGERGAEKVESAVVTSPIAAIATAIATTATAATATATAAATYLATPSLLLPSLTHTLQCSSVRLWEKELQSGMHLRGDDRGQVSGLRAKRREENRPGGIDTV